MNTVLRGARDFSWPFALVLGGGLSTLAVIGVSHNQPIAATPVPTTTVTAPPTSTTPAKPVRSHTSTPHTEPSGGGVVAASAPQSGGSGTARRPSMVAPSGPSPQPPSAAAQQPAAQCNVALAVAALNACLKLGGTR